MEELMEWFPNGSKSLFYERKYQSDDLQASIKFGQSLGLSAKTKDIFLQNTLNNHTVLSCFGKRAFEADAKPIAHLHNWISRYVHQLDNPNLLYFLNTFLMNSNESQLIFTSQETSLLNEDLLNTHRDFVFFAEKNRDGAYSEYTRADEYGLHKNLSLYKSYRNGRLGAIPKLGSPLLYLENDEEN